jgi:hypothetical protein
MAGKSTGKKSRLSGKRATTGDRSAKRPKTAGIRQFLQPLAPAQPVSFLG